MTEWQPIETAPKDGRHILAFARGILDKDLANTEFWWIGMISWTWFDPEKYEMRMLAYSNGWAGLPKGVASPTHWMPLPEPPK